ncbi:multidrug effflux MFS transporter [Candidatus Enterococcus willemsii]|uniref:Bcr/CflA family efflux transporter n=1 Tax=Candidatus Enterococcus willemsii TaxID=1857215 RepID=A0ABQ6Z3V6_9ENTE|nr:multidrug effflux MFS transporter [Enterococcus sp. CU12B]KAF1306120.1 Bcr/CflA family drug resistance efflux transporter [Enterococcus sp. CU12B]
MEKNIEMNQNKKINLALLVCLVGFPQISETIYTPSLTEIAHNYGVPLNIAQMSLSIYFVAFALGVFFWGIGSDYFGRRKAMNLGILVYVIGCIVCLMSKTIDLFFVGRFVQAFGASTGSVTTQTILRDNYSGNERHQLFAKISAALAFSPAIGPLIGGFLGEFYGFRAVFSFLLFMGIVLLFWSLKGLPETSRSLSKKMDTKKVLSVGKTMLFDRYTLTFGLLIGVFNGILFSYHSEAPTIFIEKFGLTQSQYGFMGVIVATATIFGAWLSNQGLKKSAPEIIIAKGIKLAIVGSLLLAIPALIPFSMLQVFLYIAGIFVLLAGVGMALPNCLSLALVKFASIAGTAGAFLSLGYYIIVSICTFLISILHNGSILVLSIFCLVLLIIALVSIQSVVKHEGK